MADNVAITAGTGTTVATDDIGGVHHPYVKLEYGVADSATPVSTTNPLPAKQSAITKSVVVVQNNVTLTAAAGNTTSGSTDMTATYGGIAIVKITNGGTGPTVPAQVQMQVSGDDSNYYDYGGLMVASTTNSAVTSWAVDVPAGVMYVKFVSGSNTGQDVTLRTEISKITAL